MNDAASIAQALSCSSNSRCACGRPPRRSSRGLTWRTHCPVHGDAHASLDVTETPDGKTLVICRSAGCEQKDIIDALRVRKLWAGAPDDTGTSHQRVRIVATYDYRDERGEFLFQVVRGDVLVFL